MVRKSKNRDRWVSILVKKVVQMRLINGMVDTISGKHAADRFAEFLSISDIVLLVLIPQIR